MTQGQPCEVCGQPLPGRGEEGLCCQCQSTLVDGVGATEVADPQRDEGHTTRFFRNPALRQIGDYTLEAELARGGMGIVYRAQQLSVKRPVALKLIRSGNFASEVEVERFRREAEAAATLDHHNIVPIYEVGVHEGLPYFTQKLVPGGSLAQALARGDFAPIARAGKEEAERERKVAELMVQVARAVHHAHQRGILHRDLKPSNILLDEHGVPYVTDFGLAKLASHPEEVTLAGAVLGTPRYMAPEQAMGRPDQITTASDVFSLGVTLYELLTGRPPFDGDTVLEILQSVKLQEPVPLHRLAGDMNRDLEVITLRCLEKDPAQRYRSAESLADELQRFLRLEPIQARPVHLPERLGKWARRRPAIAALTLAVASITVVGLVGIVSQWRRAEQERRLTRATNLRLELERAEDRLQDGRFTSGMAGLAYVCRQYPGYPIAPERILFALTLRSVARLAGPPLHWNQPIQGFELSPDDRHLLVHLSDGSVELTEWDEGALFAWPDVARRQPLRSLRLRPPQSPGAEAALPALGPRFSSNGRWAVTLLGPEVQLWDVHHGSPVGQPIHHPAPVRGVEFSPEGDHLLTVNRNELRLYAVEDASLQQTWMSPDAVVVCADFGPGDRQIAWGTDAGRLVLGQIGVEAPFSTYQLPGLVRWVATSPEGRFVAAAADGGTLMVLDTLLGNTPGLKDLGEGFRLLRFDSSGRLLAVTFGASGGDTLLVLDPRQVTGELPSTSLGRRVRIIAASAASSRLLIATEDGQVRIVDLRQEGGAVCEQLDLPAAPVAAAFATRPGAFLIATEKGLFRWTLWAAAPALEWTTPDGPTGPIVEPPLSQLQRQTIEEQLGSEMNLHATDPAGRRIATITSRRMMRIWDAASLQPITDTIVHKATVNAVAFSSDGLRIVTSTAAPDSALQIWDSATGLALSDPLQPGGPVFDARFAPTGDAVIAQPGLRWQLPPSVPQADGALAELAEVVVGWRLNAQRVLTPVDAEEAEDFVARLRLGNDPGALWPWIRDYWFGDPD